MNKVAGMAREQYTFSLLTEVSPLTTGECNQALAQQALVLREHMAQRDQETAMLAGELRKAQVSPGPRCCTELGQASTC